MSIANLEEILIDTKSWQLGKESIYNMDRLSLTILNIIAGLSDQGHEGR